MLNRTIASIALAILLCSCEMPPRTYEDCVLQKVPKAQTPLAAAIMRNACLQKFKPNG